MIEIQNFAIFMLTVIKAKYLNISATIYPNILGSWTDVDVGIFFSNSQSLLHFSCMSLS